MLFGSKVKTTVDSTSSSAYQPPTPQVKLSTPAPVLSPGKAPQNAQLHRMQKKTKPKEDMIVLDIQHANQDNIMDTMNNDEDEYLATERRRFRSEDISHRAGGEMMTTTSSSSPKSAPTKSKSTTEIGTSPRTNKKKSRYGRRNYRANAQK